MRSGRLLFCLYAFVLGACGNQATPTQTLSQTTGIPTEPILAVATPTPTASPTAQPALSCENWQSWPVIPGVSESVRELYQRGQESGNNPRAFSKIGDGEI